MAKSLKWVGGVILLMAALGSALEGHFAGSLVYAIGGLFCLPPSSAAIQTKLQTTFKAWHYWVAFFASVIIAGSLLKPKIGAVAAAPVTATEPKEVTATTPAEATLSERLQREIDSFNTPFKGDSYRGSQDFLIIELAVFTTWANMIREGEASDNDADKQLAQKLKQKVVPLQVSEFPKMRKEMFRILKEKLWIDDIKVSCSGKGNTTLDFVAGRFAANREIQASQDMLSEGLQMFRFKRTQYRWIEHDEYTYYDMPSKSDSELAE